jgi:hypothetical protein
MSLAPAAARTRAAEHLDGASLRHGRAFDPPRPSAAHHQHVATTDSELES